MFREPPIWVYGAEPLARRLVEGLGREDRRAKAVSSETLAAIRPGACRTLVLADPEGPAELVSSLVASLVEQQEGRPGWRRQVAPLRVILVHRADPPPPLPDLGPASPLTVEAFALEDRAARALLARWPLHCGFDPGFGQRPHLLIAGFAAPARALLVHALRLIPYDEGRARVTIACDDPHVRERFDRAYPQAGAVADLHWTGLDLPDLTQAPPVTQVFVCPDVPDVGSRGDRSLAGGAEAWSRSQAIARRIAADQGVSPPLLVEIGDSVPDGDLGDWDGQTYPFSYLGVACRAQILLDGQGDGLAQTIHEHYTDSIAAQGRDPDREPAGRPWSELGASYRAANRHQADHVGAKLAATDCRAVPEEQVDAFAFAPLEAERLAVIEHLRWAADRHLDGWSYAPVRDNARKHHPQLIPYPDLSEPMKDLDRFAVRGVPTLLARSSLGVVRMLILGVPACPPGCVVDGGLPRLVERTLERLLARYPDRSLVVASTLADPGARLLAGLALDLAGAALFLLCPWPLARTLAAQPGAAERRALLALIARAERRIGLPGPGELDRWLAERAEIQLTLGPAVATTVPKRVALDPDTGRIHWGFEY